MKNGMKRYWYAVFEFYDYGAVKAAVIYSMDAPQRPEPLHLVQYRREIFGEWFESEAEAEAAVAVANEV
jgi:hypothetical protein